MDDGEEEVRVHLVLNVDAPTVGSSRTFHIVTERTLDLLKHNFVPLFLIFYF